MSTVHVPGVVSTRSTRSGGAQSLANAPSCSVTGCLRFGMISACSRVVESGRDPCEQQAGRQQRVCGSVRQGGARYRGRQGREGYAEETERGKGGGRG